MNTGKNTSRMLGGAFLLQFVTSFFSGAVLNSALFVSEDIGEVLINIANKVILMRASMLVDTLTALGIIFLGVMLFVTLRKQGERMALVALGCYMLEAALLATSKLATFSLLRISQVYVATGHASHLQTMGTLALEAMDFVGVDLHMLVFSLGAILFYYLLDRARIVPRFLSLWGLITVSPLLVFTLFALFGHELPFFLYLPYVPFELVIGVWILVKGIHRKGEVR